ncbi:hypothetical protein AN958_06139 [Leucoagaricus sp. SymC.cos]|nr:hypothetical protein AN958_06139 [Leucoagaricus sp. SymC.cos]
MSSEAAAFTRQYLNAAGLSLLMYEQFITWETEFQSIWRSSPWNVKLTFFIARYFSLGAQMTQREPDLFNTCLHSPTEWELSSLVQAQVSDGIGHVVDVELGSDYDGQRGSPWHIKATFVLSRYFALLGQIVNVVFSNPTIVQQKLNGNCLPWFKFQMGVLNILIWNMELVMMIRVYALYGCSIWLGVFLGLWFLSCRAFNVWCLQRAASQIRTDANCILEKSPDTVRWLSLIVFVNQAGLWFLSYHKYQTARREGWSAGPLVRLVMRDNCWAFLTVAGLLFSLMPYDIFIKQRGHIIFW